MRDLFDPRYGMFALEPGTRTYYFRPSALELHLEFELVGLLVGLAVYNNHILEAAFPPVVYKRAPHPSWAALRAWPARVPAQGRLWVHAGSHGCSRRLQQRHATVAAQGPASGGGHVPGLRPRAATQSGHLGGLAHSAAAGERREA